MSGTTNRNIVLAALAPLIALSGASSAFADEMAEPEMRVWSTILEEPGDRGMGSMIQIVASKSPAGSNSLVIEKIGLFGTKTSEGKDGRLMTEVMSSVVCGGPVMIVGGTFSVAGPDTEPAEGDASDSEPEPCEFSVSGKVHHTYRPWASWDFKGMITMGEASTDFAIESPKAAMLLEMEKDEEKEESGS